MFVLLNTKDVSTRIMSVRQGLRVQFEWLASAGIGLPDILAGFEEFDKSYWETVANRASLWVANRLVDIQGLSMKADPRCQSSSY